MIKKTKLNINNGNNNNLRISNPLLSRTMWNDNTTKDLVLDDKTKETKLGRPLDIPTNQAGINNQKGNITFEKNRLTSNDFPKSSFLMTIDQTKPRHTTPQSGLNV